MGGDYIQFSWDHWVQRGKQLTLGHTGFAESGLFALQGLVGLEEKSEAAHLSGL